MKRLIFMFALFLGIMPMMSAQEASMQNEITADDYERLLENQLKVDFRSKAYKSMALTEDEIIAFDPLFNEYIQKKRELLQKKFDLTDEYKEEMAEDDTAKDEEEETAGFIENYWELDIKEMELKKDFFGRFEDVVTSNQAINFFLLEESMQNQMERPSIIRIVPMIIEFDRIPADEQHRWETPRKEGMMEGQMKKEGIKDSSMKEDPTMDNTQKWTDEKMAATQTSEKTPENTTWTDAEKTDRKEQDNWTEKSVASTKSNDQVMAYSQWVKDSKGSVALNHQYTHDGLTHLVNAVWSVANAKGLDVSDWKTKKEEVMEIAAQLQVDPLSTEHADITKEAFVMIADMIETIQTKTNDSNTKAISQSVVTAAHAIDPDQLLTKQAKKIYTFFDQANDALSKMSTTAATKASAYNPNN